MKGGDNLKENKEENKDDSNSEDDSLDNRDDIIHKTCTISIGHRLHKKLEKIHENDEENYSTNQLIEDLETEEPQEVITSLRNKISELEDKLMELRNKNNELKKNNIHNDSKIKRMSTVGVRRKFNFGGKGDDKIKMAQLIKEKNDLQEINEKMLSMLTDKELEIEELREKFLKYKNDMKGEMEKYLETIDELEEKMEIMEEGYKNKENIDNNLDEIVSEYNKYKERMEKALKEHIKKQDELQTEIGNKDNEIQNMKIEIQNLEIEKMQLEHQTEQEEKAHNAELINIDKIILENNKLKGENNMWQEKIKTNEQKTQMALLSKEEEIKALNQDLEFNKNNLVKTKEEKNKEISALKNEINKCNRDINNLIKKNEVIQNENNDIKHNNTLLQNKLDKKTKELQEINESAKKLIENKENLIQQYEEKLEEMTKEKNQLIEQNHELLDKTKNKDAIDLGDLINDEDDNDNNDNTDKNYENMLLNTEIKALREQLETQANDLVALNAMEKEVSRLNMENEKLVADYNALKEQMKKEKYEDNADDLMNLFKTKYNNRRMSQKRRASKHNSKKEINIINSENFEKQIKTLKQINEDEKKHLSDEIDKLNGDIALLKVKYLNQELENETMIAKYKSILKSINEQCIKKGIRFNININN
jgi:hypothetical protein